MTLAITGTLPPTDYTVISIVHGYAETLDPAPLAIIADIAVQQLQAHAQTLQADLVIDTTLNVTTHGLEGTRILATGTAIRLRNPHHYQHLTTTD